MGFPVTGQGLKNFFARESLGIDVFATCLPKRALAAGLVSEGKIEERETATETNAVVVNQKMIRGHFLGCRVGLAVWDQYRCGAKRSNP